MTASVFPSGGYPDECLNGHSWATGAGNQLLGSEPCECPAAAQHSCRHMWVKCIVPGCGVIWRDPPCARLQRPAGDVTPGALRLTGKTAGALGTWRSSRFRACIKPAGTIGGKVPAGRGCDPVRLAARSVNQASRILSRNRMVTAWPGARRS